MAETTRSNPLDFFREVGEQIRKVTWPDRDQLRSSTGVVALFVFVVALIIFGMDYVINHGLTLLSSLFTG
ncbi:MAG TPA: preprotein translocase subunit SecE [Longimicrobium sp.]|nr:preprotein translocase subunit SecE [Longimicrobium sp.]